MATGEDSTGRDVLQDVAGSDSFLIHAAVKCRKISRHFGWPHLVFLALAPTFPLRWDASLPLFFVMGIPSVLLGVGLRLWARGFQRSTDGLVIDGPYRYVRNPVEVGAIACFVGAGVILGVKWWFNLAAALAAIVYMSFVALAYERELYLRLGPTYLRYMQRVRRWVPSRFPATNRSNVNYSFVQAMRLEVDSLIWLAGYALVFAYRVRH